MAKIAVLGAINLDINLFVERLPKVGEEVPVREITRIPGGKGANIAVSASRIIGPGKVALIGCLGFDSIAEEQLRILREEGVDTLGVKRGGDVESGQADILIDEHGRNVINTLFGANLKLTAQDIDSDPIENILTNCKIAVIVDPPLDVIEKAARKVHYAGGVVVWHPGVRSTLGMKKLMDVLRVVDYLVLNEVEVENLSGTSDMSEAYRRLVEVKGQIRLVVTLGEKGCSSISREGRIDISGVNLEEYGMRAVNTVGCGDAFLGVFAAYKAEGLSDLEALRRANAAGAYKATRRETRGSPTRRHLDDFLAMLTSKKYV
ncbi:MAG: PfkB family carbohydrate kinase [Candidatus Bathyarchaeia archaeon]